MACQGIATRVQLPFVPLDSLVKAQLAQILVASLLVIKKPNIVLFRKQVYYAVPQYN